MRNFVLPLLLALVSLTTTTSSLAWEWSGVGYSTPDTRGYSASALTLVQVSASLVQPTVGLVYKDLNCLSREEKLRPSRVLLLNDKLIPTVTQCHSRHYRLYMAEAMADAEFIDKVFQSQPVVRFTLEDGQHPREFVSWGYLEARTELLKRYNLWK